jgi:hypothetical protein
VRPLSLLVLVVVAAAFAASAGAARTLTAGEYRRQANAICRAMYAYELPSTGTFADRLSAGVDRGRASLAGLRRLRAPAPLAALHAAALADGAHEIDLVASLVADLGAGRITLAQLAGRVGRSPYAAESNVVWRRIGAVSCVRY